MPDFQMLLHNAEVQREAVARISRLPDGDIVTNSDHNAGGASTLGNGDGVSTLANSDRDGVAVLVASGRLDALQYSRLLQCRGFVDSEIRCVVEEQGVEYNW